MASGVCSPRRCWAAVGTRSGLYTVDGCTTSTTYADRYDQVKGLTFGESAQKIGILSLFFADLFVLSLFLHFLCHPRRCRRLCCRKGSVYFQPRDVSVLFTFVSVELVVRVKTSSYLTWASFSVENRKSFWSFYNMYQCKDGHLKEEVIVFRTVVNIFDLAVVHRLNMDYNEVSSAKALRVATL